MSPRPGETAIEHEVPFHDVDVTNRVWHGHYYKYFELARTALFRAHDLEDRALIPGQYALYVVETRCRYTHGLRYGDPFRVTAWFRDYEHRLGIEYEIWHQDDAKRAARGHTQIAVTDLAGRLLLRTPEEIRRRIATGIERLSRA